MVRSVEISACFRSRFEHRLGTYGLLVWVLAQLDAGPGASISANRAAGSGRPALRHRRPTVAIYFGVVVPAPLGDL